MLTCHMIRQKRARPVMEHHYGPTLSEYVLNSVAPIIARECILRRRAMVTTRDPSSCVKFDEEKFQVILDVQHYSPEDISVKIADGYIVVKATHEEKQEGLDYVSRELVRRYVLPEGAALDAVESRLSSDGLLTVTAPRQKWGRDIPITPTGPARAPSKDPTPTETPVTITKQ